MEAPSSHACKTDSNQAPAHSITLIPLEWNDYERRRRFMRTRGGLEALGWDADVKFADRMYQDAKLTDRDISRLIEESDTDLIGMLDESPMLISGNLLSWLANLQDKSEVHCLFEDNNGSKTNFFLIVLGWLTWLFFGITKHLFRPGVVVFHKSQDWKSWLIETDDFQLHEFIAHAKQNGVTILETNLGTRSATQTHSREIVPELWRTIRYWWNSIMYAKPSLLDAKCAETKSETKLRWALLAIAFVLLFLLAPAQVQDSGNVELASQALQTREASWFSSWTMQTEEGLALDKAPLGPWLTASAFDWLGHSERVANLVAQCAIFLTLTLVLFPGRLFVDARAALISSFALIVSAGFLPISQLETSTTLLCLFSLATWYSGYYAFEKPKLVSESGVATSWMGLAGIFCGLAVLSKGPSAFVLIATPLLVFTWLKSQRVTSRAWLCFFLAVLGVAGPWMVTMAWNYSGFVEAFFSTTRWLEVTTVTTIWNPFWYFVPVIIALMFPASVFFPTMFRRVFSRKPAYREMRTEALGFLALCCVWTVAFYSMALFKQPLDILPALATHLLTARLVT